MLEKNVALNIKKSKTKIKICFKLNDTTSILIIFQSAKML